MGKIVKSARRKKPDISQEELKEIWELGLRMKELKEDHESKMSQLLRRLEDGETVEPGDYGATIQETSRVTVSWKEAFKDLCKEVGKKFSILESKLRSETEPSVTRKAKVVLLEGL